MSKRKTTRRPDRGRVPYVHLRGKTWWYQRRASVIPGKRLYISMGLRIDTPVSTVQRTAEAISERVDFGDRPILKGLKEGEISSAELVAAREAGRLEDLRRRAQGTIPLGPTIDDWLEIKEEEGREQSTIDNLTSHTRRLRDRFGEEFDMTALTETDAEAFLRKPANGVCWESRTQKTRRGTYRALWSYAMRKEEGEAAREGRSSRFLLNPWDTVELSATLPRDHEKSAALNKEDTLRLLRAAAAHSLRRLVWLILTFVLGARNKEARQVETRHVVRTRDGYTVHINTVKRGDPRSVAWPAAFDWVLEAFLEGGAGEKYLIQSPSPRRGGMYGPDQPRAWLRQLCEATGIEYGRAEGIVVHSGRHTAATAWLRTGMSAAQVAAVLGNTAEEVARTYNHLKSEDVQGHPQGVDGARPRWIRSGGLTTTVTQPPLKRHGLRSLR